MYYYTYGSFLNYKTLKKHCPKAKFVCKAVLPNWEIQFNFMSKTYNGGVSGIEPALNQLVWGVIYDVSEDELMYLDKIEGVPEGSYYRHTIIVVNEDGTPIKAYTYRTTNPKGPYKPTKKYLELIVNGAKAHKIDASYISQLESVETVD
jgi:gamma-glutamylcyclotransferase (GGCT)/AIG2-like uncharacterized protein YtfP